jgi:hypothetical protein
LIAERYGGLFTRLGYVKIAERRVLVCGNAKQRNTRRKGNEGCTYINSAQVVRAYRLGRKDGRGAKAKADTVRKMYSEIKTRFAMLFGTYTDKDMTPITEVFWFLDQIAKEMMEDKK